MTHKPTEATRKQVDGMAGCGVPFKAIARGLGITQHTFEKHYRDELDNAHVRANTAVAQSLFRKAIGDGPQSVTAAIFWLKCRMRWAAAESEHQPGKKEEAAIAARAAASPSEDWGDDLRDEVMH